MSIEFSIFVISSNVLKAILDAYLSLISKQSVNFFVFFRAKVFAIMLKYILYR